ncbi:MAG: hypothetical protein JKY65_31910 [Planctomycetes bacterium]|nr:hypothetical protein [Planctomycetota bacterium]
MSSSDLEHLLREGLADDALGDPAERGALLDLDAFPAGCVTPALGHQVLCELDLLAVNSGSPGLEPHLAECAACAVEVADAATVLGELDAPSSPPVVGLRCVYCHGGLQIEEAAYCASCLAAHHTDCFADHGSCAAPACGEERWVQSTPARSKPRFGRGWQLAALALFSATIGAGAFFDYRSDAQKLARLDALREAAVARSARNEAKRRVAELELQIRELVAANQLEKARVLLLELDGSSPVLMGGLVLLDPRPEDVYQELLQALDQAEADAGRYSWAVEMIRARQLDSYALVQHELSEIQSSSPTYVDARGYLNWLAADQLAQQARQSLVKGDGLLAQTLLAEAEKTSRIDMGEVSSETASALRWQADGFVKRRAKWSSALDAFQRAEEEIRYDRHRAAAFDLYRVVEHLPPESSYVAQAKSHLAKLKSLRENNDARLKHQERIEGLRLSLKREDWRSAKGWADQLAAAPNPGDTSWIRKQVAELDASLRLYERAERALAKDRVERLAWCLDVFELLGRWLPADHKHADPSRRRARELAKRIKGLKRGRR